MYFVQALRVRELGIPFYLVVYTCIYSVWSWGVIGCFITLVCSYILSERILCYSTVI